MQKFVDNQIERHDKYGAAMFLSPKQEKWLRDLYKEFVGTEPEVVGTNSSPEDVARRQARDDMDEDHVTTDRDIDDEVPF